MWYFNQHNEYISNLVETSSVLESAFDNFEPNAVGFLPLFYQSGYLTIKSYDKESKLYTLGLPNYEVRSGFYESLLPKISPITNDGLGLTAYHFRNALRECDFARLEGLIKASIANLPYLTDKSVCEDMYRNVLHMVFTLTGFTTTSESVSLCGRADTVVELSDKVYIFEYKILTTRMSAASAVHGCDSRRCSLETDPDKRAAEALSQIDEKHYADRYDMSGKKIIKAALVFDLTGLVAMKYE
ncbi:MAG: PD-(D/E)XK nuclease domain-containing protein [Spirochaetales bacterium]|nr:PD-(D/E)XK nuclease domain-containing protein [Spirochaetales bacterium]MBR6198916.1 PD-(D/E)XK nuclease domain-containing protein [Spirochaetales bacterium]